MTPNKIVWYGTDEFDFFLVERSASDLLTVNYGIYLLRYHEDLPISSMMIRQWSNNRRPRVGGGQ